MRRAECLEHRGGPQGARARLGDLGVAAAWNGWRAPRGQLRCEVSVSGMRRQHKKTLNVTELKAIGGVHQLLHQPARNNGKQRLTLWGQIWLG